MRGRLRTIGVLAAAVTAVALAPAGSQAAPAKTTTAWCASGATGACVESATRNGVAITATDPDWDVIVSSTSGGGSKDVLFAIQRVTETGDPNDLQTASLADTWSVTIAMGSVIPRVVYVAGNSATIVRTPTATGYDVTITAKPVVTTNQDDCDQTHPTWTCKAQATSERTTLSGDITDYGSWEDPVQRAAFYGMDFSTNVALTTVPPGITFNSTTNTNDLIVQLANQHSHPDGSTFLGFVHLTIPNAFLKAVYGVDDPSTVTAAGLTASAGVGSVKVSVVGSALRVDASNLTFSQRFLKIHRGNLAPTTPKIVKATRTSPATAKVGFLPSKPRGSAITGYTVMCTALHQARRTATAKHAPIVVKGLTAGVKYSCSVRANAKRGHGTFGAAKKV